MVNTSFSDGPGILEDGALSLVSMNITLRDLSPASQWAHTPSLGRHLRDCTLRADGGQILVECQHYDNVVRGPNETAVFYFLLRHKWIATLAKEVSIAHEVLEAVQKRCFILLETSPGSFAKYWKDGQMEKEVRVCKQAASQSCAWTESLY